MSDPATSLSLASASSDDSPRRSLLLAGGGMRVAYQAGVLRALEEAGLRFHHADGTSGGTINLAMLFSGQSPSEMCRRWRELEVKDFVSYMPALEYLKPHDMMGLGDSRGIRENVFPSLGIDVDRIRAARGIEGTFNVCNFTHKTNEAIPHAEVSEDLLVAGISLPIFTPPVRCGEDWYTDSVWIKDANLMEAVRRGSEEIWLVWCIGNSPSYQSGAFFQYVHMIEMSAAGGINEELDRIREINQRIEAGDSPYGQRTPIRLHVVKPVHPIPLDPDLYLGCIDSATLIDMGFADAIRALDGRHEVGVPLDWRATAMQSGGVGVAFNEVVVGPLNRSDVDTAADGSGVSDHPLHCKLRLAVSIDDLEGFVGSDEPTARLDAHLDIESLGESILCSRGLFRVARSDEGRRRLAFECSFSVDGDEYWLDAFKDLNDDPGWDLISDLTTLVVAIHRGRDIEAPRWAGGTLKLEISGISDFVGNLHPLHVSNAREAIEATTTFARFLLGARSTL